MSKNSYSFSTNSSLDKYTPKFLQHSQNVTNFSRKVNNPIQPVAEDKYPIQFKSYNIVRTQKTSAYQIKC